MDTILILLSFLSFHYSQKQNSVWCQSLIWISHFIWYLKESFNQKHYNIKKQLFIFVYNLYIVFCEFLLWLSCGCLVKLHYFQLTFLENCVCKKQKKSIKDERNFCSNTFFKVLRSPTSKILRYDVCASFTNRMI